MANAIKYSPKQSQIEIHIQKAEDHRVAVRVKDSGIGIEQKEHQKIFERFYRVDGKSEQTFPGFGIGLFIANEIVQRRHDGLIKIESAKGEGSAFTFILPMSTEKLNNKMRKILLLKMMRYRENIKMLLSIKAILHPCWKKQNPKMKFFGGIRLQPLNADMLISGTNGVRYLF